MAAAKMKDLMKGPGSCGEVFKIALPLILSTSAHTVQMFIDRVFLMWYDQDAMSGSMQAGITSWTFCSLFVGTVGYVNTFVAQYFGAKRENRIGPAVWQGIFFSILAYIPMLLFIFAAEPVFNFFGHDPEIRQFEIIYFKILCVGTLPLFLAVSLSGFYSGRGKTWLILYVNSLASLLNMILDYGMIFGKFGFPAMGIRGAAWATVISTVFSCVLFFALFISPKNRINFKTLSGCRFERDLFKRLMRFGMPNGIHFMLDVLAWTLFLAFLGKQTSTALTATTLVFQINMLAFMPMVGMGFAVSILVGQYQGKNQPLFAKKATWSAFYMCFTYMALIAMSYLLLPDLFMKPFAAKADAESFEVIRNLSVKLLYFVAFFCIFDTGNIIFAGALKGAGDTRYVMCLSVTLNWILLIIPSWCAAHFKLGIFVSWAFATVYVCALATSFLLRFLGGKWMTMRVIEPSVPVVPKIPDVPALETDLGV